MGTGGSGRPSNPPSAAPAVIWDDVPVSEPGTTRVGKETSALTPRGERTRTKLVDAAEVVFARLGFVETRVADIVAEAGVAHGTFYVYFDSKDAVFHAVVLELIADMRDKVRARRGAPPATAVEAIESAVRAYVSAFRDHARLMLMWGEVAGLNPDLDDLLQAEIALFIDRAEQMITRLQDNRLAARDVDARYAATALCGMVREFCTQWAKTDADIDAESASATLCTLWVRGIGLVHGAPPV
ncbi:TetR/AcrR family transcriptional regulator [Nocardia puris]|uniref:TetR family transcriptional regulator n=1 Tax=Nocardia puris TaxID=208602 RepID=A0A366DTT6_9NOCA|nr:TetR/AcrR family transcriptional regulator [Nocardia puris]MBF6215267.1 TetR/AcrR family transcriptional regulator [Nocardia puris]MBF6364208.1 TetR/AcrR family transcriptional regulator [Nocardia puris]MBF6459137.1 TetR/AcrR family transcriptional regulator [Nocardia puris]RBO92909.1 TetR family transcriptional regulator [Nocardia puris]